MGLKASEYARLPTERPNPATRGLDLLSTRRVVELINSQDALVAPAVGREAASIARAADAIAASLSNGGTLLFVGAGTSGRLGILEAAECPPTFGTDPRRIRGVMAGGRSSVFKAKEGAEDDAEAGARAVSDLKAGDVVVGIAASGITPFVRAALGAARKKRCTAVLLTSGMIPKGAAQIVINPRVGPEVITGSTRLKAATAAKLALNALTVAAMVRHNKVYDHWMVDLRPSNHKLRLRATRLIAELGRVSEKEASQLLERSGKHVKTAVVMARLKLDRSAARAALVRARGSLREALGDR